MLSLLKSVLVSTERSFESRPQLQGLRIRGRHVDHGGRSLPGPSHPADDRERAYSVTALSRHTRMDPAGAQGGKSDGRRCRPAEEWRPESIDAYGDLTQAANSAAIGFASFNGLAFSQQDEARPRKRLRRAWRHRKSRSRAEFRSPHMPSLVRSTVVGTSVAGVLDDDLLSAALGALVTSRQCARRGSGRHRARFRRTSRAHRARCHTEGAIKPVKPTVRGRHAVELGSGLCRPDLRRSARPRRQPRVDGGSAHRRQQPQASFLLAD